MSEQLLDEFRVYSLGEKEGRTGVPEIVEGDPREPRLFEQGPPRAVDEVGAADGSAVRVFPPTGERSAERAIGSWISIREVGPAGPRSPP